MYLRRLTSARRIAVLGLAIVVGGISAGFISGTAQAASNTPTQYAAETFTGAQLTDTSAYQKLSATSNVANSAALPCLTAGSNTAQTPVRGCTNPAVDTTTGALRFTTAGKSQASGVGATTAIPLAQGLDATFDSYQYGGTGADGIAFYLAATDPYAPTTPTSTGALGGALGYSYDQATGVAGINDGYLGLGLDQYGNYERKSFSGTSCTTGTTTGTLVPNVTVRGPGNGTSGYCVNKSLELPSGQKLTGGQDGTRSTSDVPVEVLINTSSTETLTSQGISGKLDPIQVAPRSYAITFKPLGTGATQQTVMNGLPTVTSVSDPAKAGWYDKDGYPYKLTYGWTSSTGGATDIHEVNRFVASSLNGAAPVLAATAADSSVRFGQTGTYTFQPSVASTGGAETGQIKVTSTFPSGVTPKAGTYTSGAYSCTVTGQQAVCTTPNTSGTAAGSDLPTLNLQYTPTADAQTPNLQVVSTVASTDALKSASSTSLITISKVPTTTTLTSALNPSEYGDLVNLTATIDQTPAVGHVTFTDTTTGDVICQDVPEGNGTATCGTTALVAGTHRIVAAYSGENNYAASTSAPLVQTVAKQNSTLVLGAEPASKPYGSASTLTAILPSDEATATGTVRFTGDDGSSVDATVADGAATIDTPAGAEVGVVTYTAEYLGDDNHEGATSNTTTVTTTLAPTTIGETVDGAAKSTITYGGTAKLAATDLPADATGTVTFTDATDATLCETKVVAGETPSCDTATDLGADTYEITAHYSGDARYAADASGTVELVVNKATVAITATATPATISYGEPTTFGVTSLPAGATGTVSYTLDGADSCTATLPDTTCAPATAPAAGEHQLVATWSGDANHEAATSPAVTVTVTKAASTIGETVDDDDAATVPYGTSATLVATDLPTDADTASAVTFVVGDDTWCTTVAANASCPTSETLPVGTYRVVARWAGDANHEPASSEPVTLTVTPQATSIAAEVDGGETATIHHGETADLTTTKLPAGASGTVEYRIGSASGTLLATGTVSGSGARADAAAATSSSLSAGTYDIVAVYSGDADHAGSTADPVQLIVAKRQPVLTDTVNGTASGTTTYGTPATLAVDGIPADATGTVVFSAGGTVLCTVTLLATSCTTDAALPAGTYAVTASYTGDADNAPATTDVAATLTVSKAAGTVVGSGSGGAGSESGGSGSGSGGAGSGQPGGSGDGTQTGGAPATGDVTTTYGDPVTLTTSGLPTGATGTVTFVDQDGDVLCSVDLTAGETSCDVPADQPVGTYTVTPTWSGDDNHESATGTPFAVVITKAPTQVTVTSGPATVWGGTTTLTIGGLPAGATGTVTLHAASTAICTITLPATSCTTSALLPGTTVVTADYSGDASYAASSATTPVVVTASHTVDPTVVQSGSSNSGSVRWPSVPGTGGTAGGAAGGVTIVVSPDRGLTTDPRTITVDANHPRVVTVDGLDPDTQYWYRVTTTGPDGTVLSTHDGTFRTAAVALTVAGQELAFTGSSFSIGLVMLGAVLLLVAGGLFVAAAIGRRRAVEELFGPRRSGA